MTNTTDNKPISWTRRTAIAGIAVAAIGAAGLGAVAYADNDTQSSGGYFSHMGGHFGHHGKHGWMNGDNDRMEQRLDWMLDKVDASADQKQKIKAIFDKARADVKDAGPEPGQMRDQIVSILKEPTIDRNAVEALVASRTETMQARAKTMTTAFLDAAEVLTPEQRAKIADAMQHRGPRW